MRTAAAWLLVVPAAAWAVMRLAGLERGFPLVPLLAYTPYAAGAAVVVAVIALLLRRRGAAAVGALAAVTLVAMVAPRAIGGDGPQPRGPTLRVLSANVAAGSVPADVLVDLARRERADLLSVQELTQGYAERLEAAGLGRLLPFSVLEPRRQYAGTGLYARTRLTPRPPVEAGFVMAVARAERPAFEVVAVHPPAPLRRNTMGFWRRGLRALPPAAPAAGGPVRILAGDFNATLDHRELRRLIGTGYRDAADAVGAGLRGTWPSGTRRTPPVTIDHVLADERVGVRSVTVRDLPGSDHKAVVAELVLPQPSGS